MPMAGPKCDLIRKVPLSLNDDNVYLVIDRTGQLMKNMRAYPAADAVFQDNTWTFERGRKYGF